MKKYVLLVFSVILAMSLLYYFDYRELLKKADCYNVIVQLTRDSGRYQKPKNIRPICIGYGIIKYHKKVNPGSWLFDCFNLEWDQFVKKGQLISIVSEKPGQCAHDVNAVLIDIASEGWVRPLFAKSELGISIWNSIHPRVIQIQKDHEKSKSIIEENRFKIVSQIFNRPGYEGLNKFHKIQLLEVSMNQAPDCQWCKSELHSLRK